MNITFRQLRVFLEVVQQGSVTRAAQELHLTTPAVSMAIKEVESSVGLQLFDRRGRALSLSTAGEYFVMHARKMLSALRDAEYAMARFKRLEHGMLTVGLVGTAKYFIPRLLAGFRAEHPGIDVRLRVSANREALVEQLDAGACDLAVMGRPPRDLEARAEAFAAHPLVFVAPPDHPLLQQEHPTLAALVAYPFIAREPGSGTRQTMARFLAERQVEPHIAMEMDSNETIKQAVMAGMGLSFLSLHTVGLELRCGLLARLDVVDTPVIRHWHVVHLQRKVLSPAAEAFRYHLLEHAADFLQAHDRPLLTEPAG